MSEAVVSVVERPRGQAAQLESPRDALKKPCGQGAGGSASSACCSFLARKDGGGRRMICVVWTGFAPDTSSSRRPVARATRVSGRVSW